MNERLLLIARSGDLEALRRLLSAEGVAEVADPNAVVDSWGLLPLMTSSH